MADKATHLGEGPYFSDAKTLSLKSNGLIGLYEVVILVTPATGEEKPRVGTTTTAGNRLAFGLVVGPELASGKASDVAGETVRVHPFGDGILEKYIAEGAISAQDPLETSTTAGALQAQAAVAHNATPAAADSDAMEAKSAAAVAVAVDAATDGEKAVCVMSRGIVK